MERCKRETRLLLLTILWLTVLPTLGQDFNTHWVYAPQADSLSHVWFRRAFISNGRPIHASVTVTTTGHFKLYVNECNVGTALFYPARPTGDSTAVSMTFDISPYLRADTNVVALLYSPTLPSQSHRQIAVNVYGTDSEGYAFGHAADATWLCRRANSRMTTDGGEDIDGRYHYPAWKAATIYDISQWLPVASYEDHANIQDLSPTLVSGLKAVTASHVESLSLRISQNPILLYLAETFYGFPRITLREARHGEKLRIGNITYTCNGNMDEQAYPAFAIGSWSAIPIEGDKLFKPSQIVSLDLLSTAEQTFRPDFTHN